MAPNDIPSARAAECAADVADNAMRLALVFVLQEAAAIEKKNLKSGKTRVEYEIETRSEMQKLNKQQKAQKDTTFKLYRQFII